MPLLVRRISRAKWGDVSAQDYETSADAITGCLRTSDNTLSTWLIESENEINDAILALITGSRQTEISSMHIIYFDEQMISDKKLNLDATNGDTVVESLKSNHRDITGLTFLKLGDVRDIVIDSIQNDRYMNITRTALKKILKEALSKGLINIDDLNPDMQNIF